MGVDYSATFGIGIKINIEDIKRIYKEQTGDEGLFINEAVENIKFPEGIQYNESGSGAYSGEENTYYLFIKDPFSDGVEGLQPKINRFQESLIELGITEYKINVIGGLHIW